jgi:glyoxylase-like metal-dependent hydrolase (beta-lactamase superfamily II)
MKIINLTRNSKVYTSNAYLVLGTWNMIGDVNTLVDVGRDPALIETVLSARTGVGKKRVQRVVLTHCHYDHAGLLPLVVKAFHPEVYAFTRSITWVDHFLEDGEMLQLGDRAFEVIHAPGHSNDSACFYCEEEGVLFTGDFPFAVRSAGATYEDGFVRVIERLCRRNVRAVYPGHGDPLLDHCRDVLNATLRHVTEAACRAN